MVHVIVCLSVGSLLTGMLMAKMRYETGVISKLLYLFSILALGFCAYFAGVVLFAFSQVELATLLTPRLVVTFVGIIIAGLAIPMIIYRLKILFLTERPSETES